MAEASLFGVPAPVTHAETIPTPKRRTSRTPTWLLAGALFVATAVCAYALVDRLGGISASGGGKRPSAASTAPTKSSAIAEQAAVTKGAATPSSSVAALVPAASTKTSASVSNTVSSSASPSVSASVNAPPTSSGSVAPPTASAVVDAGSTSLTTTAGGTGHRIYVDNRVVGEGPGPIRVPCGAHIVKVGSAGTPKDLVLPCGGEIVVGP